MSAAACWTCACKGHGGPGLRPQVWKVGELVLTLADDLGHTHYLSSLGLSIPLSKVRGGQNTGDVLLLPA